VTGRSGGFELLDLTMRLAEDTPVYPGDPAVRVAVTDTFEDAGYFNTRLTLGSHNGTHIDAEAHMVPGGRMLDAYPLSRFQGRGVLLDVRRGGSSPFEAALDAVAEDSIVLLWTSRGDAPPAADHYTRPVVLPSGLVEALIARGVRMVGIDAGSIDAEPYPVHKALLRRGILIAENLVRLGEIARRGTTEFDVWALPLNLAVEASPARIVAAFTPPA
jgi:kynurenine formamidase